MNNFILEHNINLLLCDKLIEFYENSPIKNQGKIYNQGESLVCLEIKNSTDVPLTNNELLSQYFIELNNCVSEYIKKYFYAAYYGKWTITEEINIQKYLPKQGFFQWHTERTMAISPNNNRHLVFMTYLNDVNDGGETEFYYQNVKVKPQKGKTLIWPADWTHTHRGITSLTQEKYIATGWFNYY